MVRRRSLAALVAAVATAAAFVAPTAPAAAIPIGQCATTSPTWGYAQMCRGTVGYGLTVDDRRTDGYCVELRRTSNGRTWVADPVLKSCSAPVIDGEFPLTADDRRYGMRLYRLDGAYSTVCDGTALPVNGKANC